MSITADFPSSPLSAGGRPVVFVAGYDRLVSCFAFDSTTGDLHVLSRSPIGTNPSYLAFSSDRKVLYAVDEIESGRVLACAIAPTDGRLTVIDEASSGGAIPCHVVVHPQGRWLFTANYGSGHVGILPLRDDGRFAGPVEAHRVGAHAHQVVIAPDGRSLLVPCLGSDEVVQYRFDPALGHMNPNDPPSLSLVAGAGPRHAAISPDARSVYVINELDNTLTGCVYDPKSGVLVARSTTTTLPEDVMDASTAAQVMVTPDGRFVYASNRGHDSIAIFRCGPPGMVTALGHETCGGRIRTPRNFTLTADGKFLIVANQDADTVMVFSIDRDSGNLILRTSVAVPHAPGYVGLTTLPEI